MIKIGSRFDYALSCILRIADRYSSKKPVSISYVAKKEKIEYDYAEQLLVIMKRKGLLKSVRGPCGGYILARPPDKISVRDIAEAIEENIMELICQREKGRRNKCLHYNDCKLRSLWLKLGSEVEDFLAKYTLKGLLFLRRREKTW